MSAVQTRPLGAQISHMLKTRAASELPLRTALCRGTEIAGGVARGLGASLQGRPPDVDLSDAPDRSLIKGAARGGSND